jgi:hypothetical protein
LPDLLRRVAVRTVAFAAVMALIVPLSVRSAAPLPAQARQLLAAAAGGFSTADRGAAGRARSAALSLLELGRPIPVEALSPAQPTAQGPITATPKFHAIAIPAPPVQYVAPPRIDGSTLSGRASWYCCTAGWRGEAVVALPGALGGHYDAPPAGTYVTVCAQRCARLPVVDYCDCYWATIDQKVIDLSPEAWAAISDVNRYVYGVIRVTIDLDG